MNPLNLRRYTVTDSGFLAVAAQTKRAGDIVVVVKTVNTPNVHRLVGESECHMLEGCYLKKTVDGDAFEG